MISDLEYKLFISFFALTLFFSVVRTSDLVILAYNQSVERAEREKERIANNSPKIVFSHCIFNTRNYEMLIPAQLLFLAAAFGLSFVRKPSFWVASMHGPIIMVYAYFDWHRDTYFAIVGSESDSFANTSFKSYLLYGSSMMDFVIFIAISVLLLLQGSVLVRFAVERIHARLGLDDPTPRT
jgi:hypothetical protein